MPQRGAMNPDWAQTEGPGEPAEPGELAEGPRAAGRRASGPGARRNWLSEPKAVVWIALAVALLLGGGRKLLLAWRARKAIARLEEPNVMAEEIEAVAEHGRAGIGELLRIFSTSDSEPRRQAAGRALARLWLLDQLVAEEEKAIVRR